MNPKHLPILLTAGAISLQITTAEEPVYILDDFTVSAGPTARPISDFVSPISSLDAGDIKRSNASTLGDLLNGQPGVSATSFGGGASRPIIRGFDGPRVRIVESGLGSQDVSETSPDHAVSIEPLLTERVEVLRGPSTLLYGSSAIGGVVNVVGREIPREQNENTLSGGFETRNDSASKGETNLGYVTFNEGPLAITLQGLKRDADDYEIPGEAEAHSDHEEDDDHDDEHSSGDTLEHSFAENEFYSLGASWFFGDNNYFGASVSQYKSFYGVPGHKYAHEEEDDDDHDGEEHEEEIVAIDLERTRFDAELALFDPLSWMQALRVRFGYTDYEHQELEGDETGTRFLRDGWELRTEASHYGWAIFDEGIFGIEISDTDFEAIGEEGGAFGPPSNTQSQAVFITEHIHGETLHHDFGVRLERHDIDATGVGGYDDVALSLSWGAIWLIDDGNSLVLSLQRTQRHPTSTELYANGAHLATSQFEVGNPRLEMETAYGIDLSYRYRGERWEATLSAFYTHFEDYIYAQNTGGEDEGLPVFAYNPVDASFCGLEAELDYIAYSSASTTFRIGLIADYVRAQNRDDDSDLPRIPPLRIGGKTALTHNNWDAGILLSHSFEQNDTAPLETDTDGYTELEAELAYTFDLNDRSALTLFAKANNLLDEEIRHHTSFIKDGAPRPGRNFTLGARVEF